MAQIKAVAETAANKKGVVITMNNVLKTSLIILLVIVLLVALIGFGITVFVSWVWVGIRFSPDEAMEAVGIGHSQRDRIGGILLLLL